MLSVRQLNDLYDEVKEYREMFAEDVDYSYIHLKVEEILKRFKTPNEGKLIEKIIIVFGNDKEGKDWDLKKDEEWVWTTTLIRMSANSKKYFEDLLQTYCNINKKTDIEWELTLK